MYRHTIVEGEQGGRSSAHPNALYQLKGIVVHTGQATGGHYYSYIREHE